jgi:integrase
MGHVERRVWSGKVSYRARYRDPAGRERSRSFARKADAERWLAEVEHAKTRGLWTDPRLGRIRFADWLSAWWATTTNLRPTTRARDETLLRRHALPRFGQLPLAAIGQLEVRSWVVQLSAEGLAPATVVKAYQLLGKVLAAAVDAGYLAQSPCRNVPLPKIEREEMRFLTPAEIVDLAEAIHARYRALVSVGAYGGLRIGELAGLRPSRVDLLAGAVTVAEILTEVKGKLIVGPPKTRAGRRIVGLPPFVVRELEAHLAAVQRPSSHVFTAPGGDRCGSRAFGRAFGCQRPRRPATRGCASTTFATPPWRCGSPPARRPKRSPCARGTPRSASPWTATATCIQRPIPRSVTGWRRCMRPRGRPAGSSSSFRSSRDRNPSRARSGVPLSCRRYGCQPSGSPSTSLP